MITHIVFDLAEVYLQGFLSIEAEFEKIGLKIENNDFLLEKLDSLFRGQITEDRFWELLSASFFWSISINKLKKTVRANFKEIAGTKEIVIRLKKSGYKLGLLSVHAKEWIEYCEKKFNYDELFDILVYSFQIGYCKPEKKAYQFILKKMGVRPPQCLFIDDSMKNIQTAKNLGMHTVLFRSPNQLLRDLKSLQIDL